jgi:hypothetical protein
MANFIYKDLCCPINSILEEIQAFSLDFLLLKIFYLDTSGRFDEDLIL